MTQVTTPHSFSQFGFAWCDVTPPADIYHRMWGAATHDRATGIHRPLRANVLIFGPPGTAATLSDRQVLIALDHCVMGREEMQTLLDEVSEEAKVPRETLVVVFSHTHSAGLMGLERQNLPGGDLIPGYLKRLNNSVAKLVIEATAALKPAQIVYGTGRCNLAAQRDHWDAKREIFVCGYNPGAPADDTVLVARVTDENERLLATVVNYACHPTTLAWGNTLISPDFPGAMREVVEAATDAPCVFLQGASGDLGPVEGFVGDTAVADRNGRQLGYAALSALTALPKAGTVFRYDGPVVSGATLGAWSHTAMEESQRKQASGWQIRRWIIALDYRPGTPTLDEVQTDLATWQARESEAQSAGDEATARDARAMVERKTRLSTRLAKLPAGDHYPLEATLWRTGESCWLAIQGEHYQVLQTELRAKFPQAALVICTIASDWTASYLPPADIYDKNIYQETIAVVAPGSLERVIANVAHEIGAMLQS